MSEHQRQKKRRVYLKMASVDEALTRLDGALERLSVGPERCGTETLSVAEAMGRVTARALFAAECNPHYCASAMDGYAVVSSKTAGATEASPKVIQVPGLATPVNTGEPLPQGFDAVIMIEDVHHTVDDDIEIMSAASPWQHVRLLGEDVVATELVVDAGKALSPVDIAALIASQNQSITVTRRPRVALLPTGSEVVAPGTTDPAPGQVIDYDTPLLAGMVSSWGGVPLPLDPVPDDPDRLARSIVNAARDHDLVAVIAGSSAGTADHVPNLIEELGELLVHGVRIAPGKPTAIGVIEGTPVLGIPGYSVAAWTAFELFAKPIVFRLLGAPLEERPKIQATFRRKVPSKSAVLELLRVKLGRVGSDLVAVPLKRGSSAINSLARADGLAVVPEMSEGVSPGEEVTVELLIRPEMVEGSLLAVGSHDLALDLLATELAASRRFRLASVHVGSMGGLRALSQDEAHLAGAHLLDPHDGSYNVSYIQRILPDRRLRLVHLVDRDVGLMVERGNPKSICSIADMGRDDVVMINRQRGAGTRVLLDHLLDTEGIDARRILGYEREVTTHTMVAAAVVGGAADTGLGIRAAAQALHLDFVPLTRERYDLVIPTEHWDHPGVAFLLDSIRGKDSRSRRFREAVTALGGYSLEESGEIIYEQ